MSIKNNKNQFNEPAIQDIKAEATKANSAKNESVEEFRRQIKCPQCGRLTFYSSDNPFRPFCSERCRLIDLGQWANEDYKVPSEEINLQTDEDLILKSEDDDNS